jgi:hypothetical protein
MARPLEGGEPYYAELFEGQRLPPRFFLPGVTYVTFNGINYDLPIIKLAFNGATNATLKAANDAIILSKFKPWDIEREFGQVSPLEIDHIDIMEVAPGRTGLKAYGGRLHSKRLQDLPIDPAASICPEQRAELRHYCKNDLDTTADLFNKLRPQIELREKMSLEYGLDLRSKSDAQIAEAVIRKKMEDILGHRVYRPDIHPDYRFLYRVPKFIKFQTPGLQRLLDVIRASEFSLDENGAVVMPKELEGLHVRVADAVYKLGIGGLHSTETSIGHKGPLYDRDVTSYYPSIILNEGLYPSHLGPEFLSVYREIYDTRLAAKSSGDMVVADALKIVLNGSSGKFGSKWSVLYSPELMIQVTVTGQLSLLMLIEMLELQGIPVVSANTDGVVIDGPKCVIDWIVGQWETATGFNTEEAVYDWIYQKDVNNYIALKSGGKLKLKGLYSTGSLSKNPTTPICVESVIAFLRDGYPIERTVQECENITKFLTCRKVEGGAQYGGAYLGKVVRWYYADGETRHIEYVSNGHKVAKSQGARPIMDLPDQFPDDLDDAWYIREANSILKDIGYDR